MYFSETYKYRNLSLYVISDLSIAILILVIIPEHNLHHFSIESPISIYFQIYIMISSPFALLEPYSELGDVWWLFGALFGFFVLNLILSDLAILCRFMLQNVKTKYYPTPSGNRTQVPWLQFWHAPFWATEACAT